MNIVSEPPPMLPSTIEPPRSILRKYWSHYKTTIILAVPVMFSQIGHMIVQITDNIMVGHIGTTSLAASSFGHNVFIGGLLLCIGFSAAMTPFVGAVKGKGDSAESGAGDQLQTRYDATREAAEWLRNGSIANIAFGLLITTLMLGMSFFLDRMGQTPEVVRLATPFYILMVISILPIMLFQSMRQFAEGIGNTRSAAYITIQEIILNVGLNYVLINGKFGFPALGITGSGIATLIARCSMAFTFAILYRNSKIFAPYVAALKKTRFDLAKVREYARLGLPLGGQMIMEVTAFAVGAIMMGWLGAPSLAAHQIAIGAASLTFMGANGIATAATIRVSQFFGARDRGNMRSAGIAALHIVLAYMSLTALAFVLLRNILPTFYITDAVVIGIAANLLLIAAVFQIFDGAQSVMLGTLRGLGDANVPAVVAFVAYILIALPISYVAAFVLHWREAGIWAGYVAGLTIASSFFVLRFLHLSRTIPMPSNDVATTSPVLVHG
jgi:multidrug resistance protein, MATE family